MLPTFVRIAQSSSRRHVSTVLQRRASAITAVRFGTRNVSFEKPGKNVPALTKIVATIGPSSEQIEMLQPIVQAGMRIMRLNFSHATFEEAELRVTNLAQCNNKNSTFQRNQLLNAVLLDTQGPEIRSGKLAGDTTGKKSVQLVAGQTLLLRTDDLIKDEGSTEKEMFVSYNGLGQSLTDAINSGLTPKVLLDDGAVSLTVVSINADGSVTCSIDNTGDIRSRAGVNLPGCKTTLPPMSEKDKTDIRYGLSRDVDFVAASFVRDAKGVEEIRRFMRQVMTEELGLPADAIAPLIVSKIENTEALTNFDEILEASDGIMVARGDLGVEIPLNQVINAQKIMVSACNAVGKPVIVATQMLESMAKNPRPTRAEVSDVANAVADGADCVMLSGETAKGKYPIETITTMREIIRSAESFEATRVKPDFVSTSTDGSSSSFEDVAAAAVRAAEKGGARAILVSTRSGLTARLLAKFRPSMPIVAFVPHPKVGRQLTVHRGVHPVVGVHGLPTIAERAAAALKDAKEMGWLKGGDKFVLVMAEQNEDMGMFVSLRVAVAPVVGNEMVVESQHFV